jgi:hypothetical protein
MTHATARLLNVVVFFRKLVRALRRQTLSVEITPEWVVLRHNAFGFVGTLANCDANNLAKFSAFSISVSAKTLR